MAYALVTGSSKGIGKCIAEELAIKKFDLLLVARSSDSLKSLAETLSSTYGVKVQYLSLDLADPIAPEKVKDWVITHGFQVSILVNNAGYGVWGEFEKTDISELMKMLQLNMLTLVKLTYLLLPILRKEKQSYILNIASTASYQAVPTLSAYAASKSFVLSFSRGLYHELKGSNVSLTTVSPGATDTYFTERAGISDEVKKKNEKFFMTPEAVAKIAVKAMFDKKDEVITGFVNWISAFAVRLLPKTMIESIAAGIYKH
ncbi:MAG: SDR family oxidoreductase [Cytophagales bacterium]|nr:SDR family oxidoreductase [Cytophagales bacterium]